MNRPASRQPPKAASVRTMAAAVAMVAWGTLPGPAAEVDVFFLAGQSNMAGRVSSGFVEDPRDADVRFFYATDGPFGVPSDSGGHFVPLGPLATGRFGPEIEIGRRLVDLGARPALVKVSEGATSLEVDWNSRTDGRMWVEWVAQVRRALEVLVAAGDTPRLRGFFWLQGEKDAESASGSASYGATFRAFVEDVHATLASLGFDARGMRWVTALIKDYPQFAFSGDVRQALRVTSEEAGLGSWFDTDDLGTFDGVHFDLAGVTAIGGRFVMAWAAPVDPWVAIDDLPDGRFRISWKGVLHRSGDLHEWHPVVPPPVFPLVLGREDGRAFFGASGG